MYFTSTIPGHYNSHKFKKADRKGNGLGFFDTDDEKIIIELLTTNWYKTGQIKAVDEDLGKKILSELNKDKAGLSPVGQLLSARATVAPMTQPAAQKPYQAPPAVKLTRKQLVAKGVESGIKNAAFKKSEELEQKLGIVYGGA